MRVEVRRGAAVFSDPDSVRLVNSRLSVDCVYKIQLLLCPPNTGQDAVWS